MGKFDGWIEPLFPVGSSLGLIPFAGATGYIHPGAIAGRAGMEGDFASRLAAFAGAASAIFAAVSAYWSYKSTQTAIDQAEAANVSTLGFHLEGGMTMEWRTIGNDSGVPAFPKSPSLDITNFGPRAAKAVKVTLLVEGGCDDDFIVETGPKENAAGGRLFRVTKSKREVVVTWRQNHGEFPHLVNVFASQSSFSDRADFVAVDKTYSFALPESIRNELAMRLIANHVFRYGNIRRSDGQPLKFDKPLVLKLRVEWDYQNGKPSPPAEAEWLVVSDRFESQAGDAASPINITDAENVVELDPEWRTLRFRARFDRR